MRRVAGHALRFAAGIALVVVGAPAAASAAAARPPIAAVRGAPDVDCDPARAAYPRATRTPTAQQRYDYPRIHALATGAGVPVAVIDSGVSGSAPQLRGRLGPGRDYLAGGPDGQRDEVGHGTGVASIIAAAPARGTPFEGLAPGVRILPLRVADRVGEDTRTPPGDPARLAAAIRWAVRAGARVLNLSLTLQVDDDRVRAAVDEAVRRDVVVVAAAGNAAGAGNPTPYPAAYPKVLAVGAVGADSGHQPYSQTGWYVDVVAPGERVTVAGRRAGQCTATGTSYAAPFVAATAALLRERFPDLSAEQVTARIVATADPAPGGRRSDAYGAGVLNPYRALTETVVARRPPPAPGVAVAGVDPGIAARARQRAAARTTALRAAGAGVAGTVAIALLVPVLSAGRRRRWRPAASG